MRVFGPQLAQYFNKPTMTRVRMDGEQRRLHVRRQEPQHSTTETPPTSGREEGGTWVREKLCERARAFNKVLRFFTRGKLAYGSSGMSNGCREIACRFTHQANFPAYRDAIFLPLPRLSVWSIIALLLFHPPRILHRVRFSSHHHHPLSSG